MTIPHQHGIHIPQQKPQDPSSLLSTSHPTPFPIPPPTHDNALLMYCFHTLSSTTSSSIITTQYNGFLFISIMCPQPCLLVAIVLHIHPSSTHLTAPTPSIYAFFLCLSLLHVVLTYILRTCFSACTPPYAPPRGDCRSSSSILPPIHTRHTHINIS